MSRLRTSRALLETDDTPRFSGEPALLRDPRRGFRSLGEFGQAVRAASIGGADERLRIAAAAATTFGNENAGADGGFAVPPQFAAEVTRLVAEQSLLELFDVMPTSTNSALFPKDETTPWGNVGIRASWLAEGVAATPLKPVLGATSMRLHKLAAFVPITDELLADSPLLDTYLVAAASDAIAWRASDACLNGTGAGMPAGLTKSAALVTVTKDSGQAAGTLSATNISGMLSRLLPGSYGRAVWLADETLVPVLTSIGSTQAGFPISFDVGDGLVPGTSVPMLGRLAGRPIVVTQHNAALSSAGDLLLIDPKAYRVLVKDAGIATALSMHMYFDADVACFRFTFRVDGTSKFLAPVAPPKGSATLSPFIALGAR